MASNAPYLFSSLTLEGFRQKVHLGCGEEERRVPQFVQFNVEIRFSALPQGCLTDDLEDTVCYAEMSEALREICQRSEYRLIEKLGWTAYSTLKKQLPPTVKLRIKLIKEKPPVPDLLNGSSFCVGDWAEG